MATTWTVGVDAETIELRERLAKRFPLTSKHKIAKLCLAYGVRSAERDPSLLIEEDTSCAGNDAEVQR